MYSQTSTDHLWAWIYIAPLLLVYGLISCQNIVLQLSSFPHKLSGLAKDNPPGITDSLPPSNPPISLTQLTNEEVSPLSHKRRRKAFAFSNTNETPERYKERCPLPSFQSNDLPTTQFQKLSS